MWHSKYATSSENIVNWPAHQDHQDIRSLVLPEEAMIFESAILSFQKPSPRTLDAVLKVFNNVESSEGPEDYYPLLGGHSARIFYEVGDLVSLCQPIDEDRLTRFIRHYFTFCLVVSHPFNRRSLTLVILIGIEGQRGIQLSISFGAKVASHCGCSECDISCRPSLWRNLQSVLCQE